MKVTLSLSAFYGNVDFTKKPLAELTEKIGVQLGAIEEVINLGQKYKGVLVARVVSCEDHPNADRLHVCKIDDGGAARDVARDADGYVQVVCGAPNVRKGLLVAWLPPGSTVPSTFDKEPFVLKARELRGVMSNGMLASARELGISDDHEGILEIDEDIASGTSFVDAYHLDDHIIDIENKMFTHRPDCFGVLGVYRELAGIYGEAFESPTWYTGEEYDLSPETSALPLNVSNRLPELVPRFVAIPMSGVTVKPSPVWLQVHLMRVGIRPINNIVDITNYLMYVTGQPLHAYDYDKVKALGGEAQITVRHPRKGEKVKLLNGKEIEPWERAVMIAAGDHLIGVGGAMGGSETEVDVNTKNIILEVATFDMYSIRRASMMHGIFTDAVTRFNKGQSPLQDVHVMARAVHDVRKLAGGKVAGELIDDNHVDQAALARNSLHQPVRVTTGFINARLGLELSADDMATLLENVEFKVSKNADELTITAPFWRTDIEIPEDIVEEVGRLYGYDHLPLDLPRRDLAPAIRNQTIDTRARIRDILEKTGANEVLTYTFVHGDLLDKVGQNREYAFRLSNALSPDLQYYRLSVTPSLLNLIHGNIKAGFDQFALFEMNAVHGKTELDDDGLPREFARLAFVVAAEPKTASKFYAGAPYYHAKQYAATLLAEFELLEKITFKPLTDVDFGGHELLKQMAQPFEPKRAAMLMNEDFIVGIVGEYKSSVRAALKLPDWVAGFELFASAFKYAGSSHYQQLPRFPKIEQDISLKVPAGTTYGELHAFLREQLESLKPEYTDFELDPLDIYQRADDGQHKQITFRLTIASFEKTLRAEDVNSLLDTAARKANERFGAERL